MIDLEFSKLELEFVIGEIKRIKKELETDTEIETFKELFEHLQGLERDRKKLIKVLGL